MDEPNDDEQAARSLLDQLLAESRLYRTGKDYRALLEFVARLRGFAPFNAMLLQVQKPGMSYAASAHDWRDRFGRKVKEGARPLLILWPFGPVALVYDVMDTEGAPLPEDVASFVAHGDVDEAAVGRFRTLAGRKGIDVQPRDAGDLQAGSIRLVTRAPTPKERSAYRVFYNRHHTPAVQFSTLAHEFGHLFLGHLGADRALNVPDRRHRGHVERELEAESVAYLVCARNGVTCKSQPYLAEYVCDDTTVDALDIYQVMKAAGQVETLLQLAAQVRDSRPSTGEGQRQRVIAAAPRQTWSTFHFVDYAKQKTVDSGWLSLRPSSVAGR